ncbi:hypothetical protein Tco_0252024 [Tanacetum coccineum]
MKLSKMNIEKLLVERKTTSAQYCLGVLGEARACHLLVDVVANDCNTPTLIPISLASVIVHRINPWCNRFNESCHASNIRMYIISLEYARPANAGSTNMFCRPETMKHEIIDIPSIPGLREPPRRVELLIIDFRLELVPLACLECENVILNTLRSSTKDNLVLPSCKLCHLVEFRRISLTGFRSCTSRSHYQSVSKQTTRVSSISVGIIPDSHFSPFDIIPPVLAGS